MAGKSQLGIRFVGALVVGLMFAKGALALDDSYRCAQARDLLVVNGKIMTMDPQNSIVSAVSIKDGRFDAVGRNSEQASGPCTRVIDVHGRLVVPGIVDNHNHFVLLSLRPGNDVRLEGAASIADVQAFIKARVQTVPPGAWITAAGGWVPFQFTENRLPLQSELDAAAPNNPVLIFDEFTGPASTNTLGSQFFRGQGIAVNSTGQIAAGGPSVATLDALRAIQTFDDKVAGTIHAMNFAASVGVTTAVDMGGFVLPDTPDAQDSYTADNLAGWDPWTAHDPMLSLWREGKTIIRLRFYFPSQDEDTDLPLLNQRTLNTFRNFGDSMMRITGIGERITTWVGQGGLPTPAQYQNALEVVAQGGWIFQQHSLSLAEDQFTVTGFEAVNSIIPIADLHWAIAHVPHIDQPTLNRVQAVGAGVALHGFGYLSPVSTAVPFVPNGPPYRLILDSGIQAGAGSDSANISVLSPWRIMYYMVTGMNVAGQMVNPGQTATRWEALNLYTARNGWFVKEEDKLGSIEVGKYGDLVVVSDDYFDTKRVPDAAIQNLHSVLTVVGGRVVYSERY